MENPNRLNLCNVRQRGWSLAGSCLSTLLRGLRRIYVLLCLNQERSRALVKRTIHADWTRACERDHLGTTKGFLYFWLSRLLAISVRSKSMCMAVYDAPPSVAEACNPQALALCHSIRPTPSHLLSPALAFSGIIKAFKWFSGSRKAQLKAVTTVAVGLSAPNGTFVMIDGTLVS